MPIVDLDTLAFYAWPASVPERELPPIHKRQLVYGDTPAEAALQYVLRFQPVAVVTGKCLPMRVSLCKFLEGTLSAVDVRVAVSADVIG